MKQQKLYPLERLIVVDWDDSSSRGRWSTLDEYRKHSPVLCRSVGYVTHRDKRGISLVQTMADNGDVVDAIAIPAGCIRKVRRLT